MHAAPIQWRPLGEILVERGFLTSDELEDVLQAQQLSGRPLGQILVDRGVISAPTLAVTLAEQCGVELQTEAGFGSGLWSAIQRRHKSENRRRDLHVVQAPQDDATEALLPVDRDEAPTPEPTAGTAGHAEEARASELERIVQERTDQVAALEASERANRRELEQLFAQLEERDARLREMAAHQMEIEATSARLGEANVRVVELEEALQERQRRADELEAERPSTEPGSEPEEQAEPESAAPEKLRSDLKSLKREQKELSSRERSLRKEAASVDRRARELSERADRVDAERRAIEERAESLHERELALDALAADLAGREQALAASAEQLDAASTELTDRRQALVEAEQRLAGREKAVLTAASDLERRRSSVEERERALEHREAELRPDPPPPVEPIATETSDLPLPAAFAPSPAEAHHFVEPRALPEEPRPADGDAYNWKLDTLARLVDQGAESFPDRVDEWRFTLFYLRDEARIDGALPRKFDSLVEEAFGDLLAQQVA
jgi:hypothetical protein